MPKTSDETGNFLPVFQSQKARNIDLALIEQGEKKVNQYKSLLLEAENCLIDPDLSSQSRENIAKLIEEYTPRLRETEERLNAHKARLGLLEVNQPIKIQP